MTSVIPRCVQDTGLAGVELGAHSHQLQPHPCPLLFQACQSPYPELPGIAVVLQWWRDGAGLMPLGLLTFDYALINIGSKKSRNHTRALVG